MDNTRVGDPVPIAFDNTGRLGAETLFGLLAGSALLPVALTWIVPSMLVFGVTGRLRGVEVRLTNVGTLASLALALIVLWGVKLAVLPGILEYVPLSAWLPVIPSWLASPMQFGIPALVSQHWRSSSPGTMPIAG